MANPFYLTTAWRSLRAEALKRDRYTCVVPGCRQKAVSVDHIKSRRIGGADALFNLRSLCRAHDNQIKEGANGIRKHRGLLTIPGCNASGLPLDPEHPWRKNIPDTKE